MKTILKTPDEIIKQALFDFDDNQYANYELESIQDIIQYDDDNKKIQLIISQKKDGLSENEYHYSINIMIYTNNIDTIAQAVYGCDTKTMSTEELKELIIYLCNIEWDKANTDY